MFLVPLYGAQTVIAVLHLPYLPCAPVWCPNCHCWLHLPFVPCAPVWRPNCHCCAPSTICSLCPCPNCHCSAPSTICSLCPCIMSKLSLLCSIYHMFLEPLYGVQPVIAVLHLPYVPCAPCMVPKLSLLCSIYHMFLVPLYGAQSVIAVLHLPYVPCAPVWCPNCHCCAPSTICSLCPLYGVQTVIAVLHLPYVPCAPVWCPNCHCCAPSTICSFCPCMVSKLSLMCSIYHMFLVPLYGVQTDIAVLHLPYVPCAPVWCPNCHCCAPSTICSSCPCMVSNLSLLCSIYHMFLVPLYGAQTVIAVLHLPYVPCAPCMVPKLSLLCSIYHMFLVPLVWCPNCHCCAPSTNNYVHCAPVCSLCPQTVIAVLHLPYVPCAPIWCPNCH